MFYSIKFLVSFIDLNVLVVFIKLLYSSHLVCFFPTRKTSKNCLHRNTYMYLSLQLQIEVSSRKQMCNLDSFPSFEQPGVRSPFRYVSPICAVGVVKTHKVRSHRSPVVGRHFPGSHHGKNWGKRQISYVFLIDDVSFQNVCHSLNNHRS